MVLCFEGGSCGCLPVTPAAAAASVLECEILAPIIAKFVVALEEAGVSGAVSCVSGAVSCVCWRGRGRLRLVRFSICIMAASVSLAQVYDGVGRGQILILTTRAVALGLDTRRLRLLT